MLHKGQPWIIIGPKRPTCTSKPPLKFEPNQSSSTLFFGTSVIGEELIDTKENKICFFFPCNEIKCSNRKAQNSCTVGKTGDLHFEFIQHSALASIQMIVSDPNMQKRATVLPFLTLNKCKCQKIFTTVSPFSKVFSLPLICDITSESLSFFTQIDSYCPLQIHICIDFLTSKLIATKSSICVIKRSTYNSDFFWHQYVLRYTSLLLGLRYFQDSNVIKCCSIQRMASNDPNMQNMHSFSAANSCGAPKQLKFRFTKQWSLTICIGQFRLARHLQNCTKMLFFATSWQTCKCCFFCGWELWSNPCQYGVFISKYLSKSLLRLCLVLDGSPYLVSIILTFPQVTLQWPHSPRSHLQVWRRNVATLLIRWDKSLPLECDQ